MEEPHKHLVGTLPHLITFAVKLVIRGWLVRSFILVICCGLSDYKYQGNVPQYSTDSDGSYLDMKTTVHRHGRPWRIPTHPFQSQSPSSSSICESCAR